MLSPATANAGVRRPLPGEAAPSAQKLIAEIILALPKRFPGARAWRRNVGVGYSIARVRHAISFLKTRPPDIAGAIRCLTETMPVSYGIPGEPDIDGWVPIIIPARSRTDIFDSTLNDLAVAVRIGIEVKSPNDPQSVEQKSYQAILDA